MMEEVQEETIEKLNNTDINTNIFAKIIYIFTITKIYKNTCIITLF